MSSELSSATTITAADSISSIKRSTARFFSATVLSRISGLLRDMALAFCFGTHEALAALLLAFRLSHVCRRLFGEGAMQAAFIPAFEELRKKDESRAFLFFRDLMCTMTLFLVGFIALSVVGLLATNSLFDLSPGNRQIVSLASVLMPSLLFICLFGLNSSLLQCQKRYFTVGIAPAFFNILVSIASLFFIGIDPNIAMPYIATFLVLGCLVQWFATFIPALKLTKKELGIKIFQNIKLLSSDLRRMSIPLSLGFLGVGASAFNNFIDTCFARWVDPEGPAQLWYAMRLLQMPLALFGIVLSGALLPPLSRSIQAGRKEEYLHFLDFAMRRVVAFLLPCSLGLYIFGIPVINLIYGRGDFQLHSIVTTCECLHGYALGLLPMGLIIILAPAFNAYKDFKRPAIGACLSLGINFLLNCIFIFIFDMKAISITLATSIAAWVNVIYLYSHLKKHFGVVVSSTGIRQISKLISITFACALMSWLFQYHYFVPPTFFHFFQDAQILLSTNLIDQIVALAVPVSLYFMLILAVSWLFKADDLLVLCKLKKETKSPINSSI